MRAGEFYRILSQVKGMEWSLEPHIKGRRNWFFYSPETAVASAVRRDFVDRSNKDICKMLNLDRRTYRTIHAASLGSPGHSSRVRRKLLKACGLLK